MYIIAPVNSEWQFNSGKLMRVGVCNFLIFFIAGGSDFEKVKIGIFYGLCG
jgi:hypothetical protein